MIENHAKADTQSGSNGVIYTKHKKMGYQEVCYTVFRAPNGKKYFDYDIEDSFYARKRHTAK